MNGGYTKLFGSILASTIWSEDDKTRIVWITMLALADANGEVQASVPGLARIANVPLEATEAALKKLSSPDTYSRTPEFEGRRIEAIPGGWVILNYPKYREKASEVDRREQARLRQQRHRDREKVARDSEEASITRRHALSRSVTENNGNHDRQRQRQKQTPRKNIEKASSPPLTSAQREVAVGFEQALGDKWAGDAGKWVNLIKSNVTKARKVLAEVQNAIKEGRIKTTSAQYAHMIWENTL